MGSQRVGHDWETELNWTEYMYYSTCSFFKIEHYVAGIFPRWHTQTSLILCQLYSVDISWILQSSADTHVFLVFCYYKQRFRELPVCLSLLNLASISLKKTLKGGIDWIKGRINIKSWWELMNSSPKLMGQVWTCLAVGWGPEETPPQHWVPLNFCQSDTWKILTRFHLDQFFCEVKHLFVYSLAIWMSSFMKCIFLCLFPYFSYSSFIFHFSFFILFLKSWFVTVFLRLHLHKERKSIYSSVWCLSFAFYISFPIGLPW